MYAPRRGFRPELRPRTYVDTRPHSAANLEKEPVVNTTTSTTTTTKSETKGNTTTVTTTTVTTTIVTTTITTGGQKDMGVVSLATALAIDATDLKDFLAEDMAGREE
jgi:hypothetical protein